MGRRLVWVLAALLLVVGLAGFGLAALASSSNQDTFAEEYQALGDRDAAEATDALDTRITRAMRAYNAYVASAEQVQRRHEAVTDQFNKVVKARDAGDTAAASAARARLGPVIARYLQALERERRLRSAYFSQLARLDREVAR